MKVLIKVVEGPDAGKSFVFTERDRFIVGRAPDSHLCVAQDGYFSRHHFMVEVNPPNMLLVDMASTNGTRLNDGAEPVAQAYLKHGDHVLGGQTRLVVEVEADKAPFPATELAIGSQSPESSVATGSGLSLDDLLGPRTGGGDDRAAVRCLRCGNKAANEQPRARSENMAYFCDGCQSSLMSQPILAPGYRLVRELGRGGMGAVYLVVHQVLGTRALKMILPKAALSDRLRKMFVREASAQAQLSNHPNVVQLHDFQEVQPGIFCMVMEYVDGESADSLLERAGGAGLDPRLAVDICAQTLAGLDHAHRMGVVHRDIKDANILVARLPSGELRAKLADFGLAKSYETSGASGFTRTGDVAGSLAYMAPEQIVNFRDVKPVSDLYSMGVTLYRLLTGHYPLEFVRGVDPMVVVLEAEPVPILRRRPGLPTALGIAVDRSIAKNPAHRFQTAGEMAHAIQEALAHG